MRRGPHGRTRRWQEDQTGRPGDKRARRADQEMGRRPARQTRGWEVDKAGGPGDEKSTRRVDQDLRRGLGGQIRS